MCRMFCPYGFKQDSNGCDICECETCPPVMCAMFCENGFKKDASGCDICQCETCPPVMCALYCEHGYQTDDSGCDICSCNPPPRKCFCEDDEGGLKCNNISVTSKNGKQ